MDPAWEAESVEVDDGEYDDNGFPSCDPSSQVLEESVEEQSLLHLKSTKGWNDKDDCLLPEEEGGEDDNGVDLSAILEEGSNAPELQNSTKEKQEDSGGTTQDFREPDDTSKVDERQSAATSYGEYVSPAVERQSNVCSGADQDGHCDAERPITLTPSSNGGNQDDTNKKHVLVEVSVDAVNCDVPVRESSFQDDFKDLKFAEKGEGGSRRTRSDESDIYALERTPDEERSLAQKTQDDGKEKFTALPDGGKEVLDPDRSRDDRKGSFDLGHQGSHARKKTRQRDKGSSDVADCGSSSKVDSYHSTKSDKVSSFSTKLNFLTTIVLFFSIAINRGVTALTVIPEDVLVSSGSIARLRCSTDDSSPVYWERRLFGSDEQETIYYGKNGLARTAGDRFSIERDSSSGRYDLVISNVRLEDAGTYTCIDEAGIGEGYPAELVVSGKKWHALTAGIAYYTPKRILFHFMTQ